MGKNILVLVGMKKHINILCYVIYVYSQFVCCDACTTCLLYVLYLNTFMSPGLPAILGHMLQSLGKVNCHYLHLLKMLRKRNKYIKYCIIPIPIGALMVMFIPWDSQSKKKIPKQIPNET